MSRRVGPISQIVMSDWTQRRRCPDSPTISEVATVRNVPTQERSRQTLDDIMEAANQLFYRGGVEGTKIRDIASEAGVSVGSLYRFFPNKEALVDEYVARYMAALTDELASEDLPLRPGMDDIATVVDALIERSARVRSHYVGYGAVRNWREPETGHRPSQVVYDAELAMVMSLIEGSAFDPAPADLRRIATIVVLTGYPVMEVLPTVSKAEGKRLRHELKVLLTGYLQTSLGSVPADPEPSAGSG